MIHDATEKISSVIAADLERVLVSALGREPDAEELDLIVFAAETTVQLAKYLNVPELQVAHPEWGWQMCAVIDYQLHALQLDGVACIARDWIERGRGALAVAGHG